MENKNEITGKGQNDNRKPEEVITLVDLQQETIDLRLADYPQQNESNATDLDHKNYFTDINYTDSAGYASIREKTAQHISKIVGVKINPATVFLTNGADHAISVALTATSKIKNGNVYLPAPYYFKYPHQIDLYHKGQQAGKPATFDQTQAIDHMIEAAKDPATSAIIFNNPNNPLGNIYPYGTLDRILAACETGGPQIIYDVVYGDTLFDEADNQNIRLSDTAPLKDKLWIVGSISKSHGVPGWRLGFLVCPEESIALVEHITEILSSNISTISQKLLNEVLTLPSFNKRRDDLKENMMSGFREIATHLEEKHPWLAPHLLKPQAGIFCCLDVREYCADDQLLRQEMEKKGILIKVGSALGCPGLIRLPLTTNKADYAELFNRLEEILQPNNRPENKKKKGFNAACQL